MMPVALPTKSCRSCCFAIEAEALQKDLQSKSLAGSVLRNPFVISAAIGILLNLAGLRLPYFIEKAVGDLSQSATPIALLLLGALCSMVTLFLFLTAFSMLSLL